MYIFKTKNVMDLNKFQDEAIMIEPKIESVILFGEDQLRFKISEALTAQEETDLDNFITAFVDQDPEDKVPKIMDLVKGEARHKHHHNIDYKKELTVSLVPKRTVVQGEVTKVDWYTGFDGDMNLINPVLRVEVNYNRDATGFATDRHTTRTWINRDGSDNEEVKATSKFYFVNPSDMIDEGLRRRKLLVNSIQIPTLTFMTEVLMPLGYSQEAVVLKGRAFMDDYEQDFSNFVENSSTVTDPANPDAGMKNVVVRLRDENNTEYIEWLDRAPASLGGLTTIRQYLMSEFTI